MRRSTVFATVVMAFALAASARTMVDRSALLSRAQIWRPIDTASADIVKGPADVRGFAPGQTVECRYQPMTLAGNTPKFACEIGEGDSVKVKYGGDNGEVYAEVAATRLLWALGFGADRMYPVRVVCENCPESLPGIRQANGNLVVTPAAIERKFPAPTPEGVSDWWSWGELDKVTEAAGGAPKAHRDALKLMAVFLQHTDNKAPQQRIVCLDRHKGVACERPLLILNDVGRTFGRASKSNGDATSSANLEAWSHTPVWRDGAGCVGNLSRSFTGTLENPPISEEGRAFLAQRLKLLSDRQLHDLFSVARFELRPRDPRDPKSGAASIDEWVAAFKAKRAEIADRHCS